jgi:hypothetical protein
MDKVQITIICFTARNTVYERCDTVRRQRNAMNVCVSYSANITKRVGVTFNWGLKAKQLQLRDLSLSVEIAEVM